MAAPQHGEAPFLVRPSKTFASILAQSPSSSSSGIGHLSTYKGEPSLVISRQDMLQIAAPYSNALVGRFAVGRPSMEIIRKFIVSLGLKGECPIGLLDSKHILLRPSVEEDYTRLWCRKSWYIGKFHMSLSKWTIDFKPGAESSIAPVWVNFPGLPLPFFEKQFLLKLGNLLGRPLKVDEATAALKRPSVARLLLEVDVLNSPRSRIWIGDDQWGFWQKIEYEEYPSYCVFCSSIGHVESTCHQKHPELRPVRRARPSVPSQGKHVFQPKGGPTVDESPPVVDSGVVTAPRVHVRESSNPTADVSITVIPSSSSNPVRGNPTQTTVHAQDPVLPASYRGGAANTQNDLSVLTCFPPVSSSPVKALSDTIPSFGRDEFLLTKSVPSMLQRERACSLSPRRHEGHARLVRYNSERQLGLKGIALDELKNFSDRLASRITASKLSDDPVVPGALLDDTNAQLLQNLVQGHKTRGRQTRKRDDPIKFIVWNIRGAANKESLRHIRSACRSNDIRLLILLEPLANVSHLDSVQLFLGFDFAQSFLHNKIWIFWCSDARYSFVEAADQVVHIHVSFPSGSSIFISAVYARCNRIGRRQLWEALEHFSTSVTLPWMAVGDYNVISSVEERIGGSAPNIRDLEEFNSALNRSGLFPVQFDGSAYTWTNGRMWQRLDRAVVNAGWLSSIELTRVAHLQRGRSDHCPLLVKGGSMARRRSSFRFLNVWRSHPTFQQTVTSAWAQPVPGIGMQKFFNKLKVVKRVLAGWNVDVFGNVSQRVKVAADNLLAKELLYDQNRDVLSRSAVHEARALHSRELALECEFWRQKAAIKWIKEGDANTSFFHATVKQKRSSNFIARIRGTGDSWLDNIEDIKLSASDFFSSLFTADRDVSSGSRPSLELPKLTPEENDMLLKSPSVDEVYTVVCSMDPQSAAGPDGFGGGFYQSCWECIRDDFMDGVQDFFAGATMPRGFSSTTIILLPKREGACEWKDFRPISLANVSAKIISKVLSTRINQLLPRLVLEFQTGFIPGRGIQDNVLLAQELILDLDKKLCHPNVILKLDMEKAYDRVDWGFLLYMLREFGFKEGVVDLVFRLVSNVWFSVLVNGELTGFFKSTRGVRQGDPLSSTLFLFVSEFLGRGLQRLFSSNPAFRFLSKGGMVPFLAFADDVIIFTRASSECLQAVSSFLHDYQALSGQKINLSKSRFLCSSKLSSEVIQLIQQETGFQGQPWPVKYLGVPLSLGRNKTVLFDGVIASVRAKLHHWSSRFLSAGGKLILIRHVLSSMPLYLLQVTKPPKGVFIRLGKLFNAFLWDGKDGRRIHWSSWEKVCFPVEEGGLGFRSLLDLERAFAMKLWWTIRQKSSPWARFMHRKYIGEQHPGLASAAVGSATWKRVCLVRAITEDNIRWRLGEGFIDFWYDRWLFNEPLSSQVTGAHPHFLVAEFYTSTGWNTDRLLQVLPRSIVNIISQTLVDPKLKDELIWAPSADGAFSVSSAWELVRQRRNTSLVCRGIWCPLLPLKMSYLAWRVLSDFLPLDDKLRSRGMAMVSKCDCCGNAVESLNHIFLHGRLASAVWQHFFLACGIQWRSFSCVSSLLVVWFQSSSNGRLDHVRCVIPVVVLWFLWRSRNDARFGNLHPVHSKVIFEANGWLVAKGAACMLNKVQLEGDMDTYFARFFRVKPAKSFCLKAISWMKPPRGTYKLNTDASVINGLAKGGGVVRDFEGKMIGAFYKEFGEYEVVYAEGLALCSGLQWCMEAGLSDILVEVDSLVLVRLVQNRSVGKWPLCSVLSQLRLLLGKVKGSITHIHREANAVADSLAALSREGPYVTFQSVQQLPSRVRSLINLDAIGFPYIRRFPV
ncbi:uncharacterized protein [Coffea arabica]|uniref:Reverse transcriptase domain-containing protein n=1 Tax=Coffea arabica TaxID=13443 RepID=A0A6P6X956_COFAR